MFKSIIGYWESQLGIQRSVVVTLILTLSTFSLGFIINWTASYIIRGVKKRRYRKSLKVIIADFLQSCNRQSKEFENILTQKGYLHGENYIIPNKSNFGQNYLTGLDISVFIENFSANFKKTDPMKFVSFLN